MGVGVLGLVWFELVLDVWLLGLMEVCDEKNCNCYCVCCDYVGWVYCCVGVVGLLLVGVCCDLLSVVWVVLLCWIVCVGCSWFGIVWCWCMCGVVGCCSGGWFVVIFVVQCVEWIGGGCVCVLGFGYIGYVVCSGCSGCCGWCGGCDGWCEIVLCECFVEWWCEKV